MGKHWSRTSSRLPHGLNIVFDMHKQLIRWSSINAKFFVHDTSQFSFIKNVNSSAKYLKHDLTKISNCVFQRNMNFNPDLSNQAQEVIFRPETKYQYHRPLFFFFSRSFVIQPISRKDLGMVLGSQLNYRKHLQSTLNKLRKITSLLQKIQNVFPRSSLLKTSSSFTRPVFDYGDVI